MATASLFAAALWSFWFEPASLSVTKHPITIEGWPRECAGLRIAVLEDRNATVVVGDCKLALVGISDYWEGPHDIDLALRGVAPAQPIIAFTHNPDLFPELPTSVGLLIAGHTHGGQVNLPFFGPVVVPSKFGTRYARGHITEEGRDLFVSSGVGTSILPVRFRVPPEVAVVVLNE